MTVFYYHRLQSKMHVWCHMLVLASDPWYLVVPRASRPVRVAGGGWGGRGRGGGEGGGYGVGVGVYNLRLAGFNTGTV